MNDEYKEALIREESIVLDFKLKLINNEIDKNTKIINGYSIDDINMYRKVDESKYTRAVKEQKKLKQSLDNPYFGRLDIEYEDDNEEVTIYIGKQEIDIEDNTIIFSWAAPIANIYQEYNLGHYKYKHVDRKTGKEVFLTGNVTGKRKIDIKRGKVQDVYSYNQVDKEKEENFIKEKIESSDTNKLDTILETMQIDQNKIIRLPIEKNVLVQGCAGSGKSSVAFHRLAYLAYNYNLNEEQVIAISPNKIFQGYTSDILMDLGSEFNVKQYTFNEFAELILKKQFEKVNKFKVNKEVLELKTSKKFKNILDRYIKYIDENYIPNETISIDGFKFIDKDEMYNLWKNRFAMYKVNDKIDKFKLYVKEMLVDRKNKYISRLKKIYEDEIDNIKKNVMDGKIFGKEEIVVLIKNEREMKIDRIEKEYTAIIGTYMKKLRKIEAVESYKELLKNKMLFAKLSESILDYHEMANILKEDNKKILTDVDSIPILYLFYNLNENNNKYRHMVIDECQDLSYLEVAILESLTNSFTLVGDFNQRIDINKSIISLSEIDEIFNRYTYFEKYFLNKSFRNPKSITNYSNAILQGYFINEKSIPIAFNREVTKPKVYLKIGYKEIVKSILESTCNIVPNKNIAVILKRWDMLEEYYKEFSEIAKGEIINLIYSEYCEYKKGINILPAQLSKGLEFDYVFIVNAEEFTDSEEDRRLLYISTTRALHGLEIYTQRKECFVTSIDKSLWEGKFLSVNPMCEGIIKILTEGFGELPQEYKNYVESMTSFAELANFTKDLEDIEDIDKLFESKGIVRKK